MRTDFNRCNITLVCVVINCLNLTKMFVTGKIGLKLFQPIWTWQNRHETAFTNLKRNAMTIFVFWNWCNIKACSLYENRLLTLVCVISGVQNLKSEGETESGIPLPWSGYIATGGLFQVGVEVGIMSQIKIGTYTEFPPAAAKVFGEWSGNITIVHMHLCISVKVIEVRSSNINIAAFNILTKGYAPDVLRSCPCCPDEHVHLWKQNPELSPKLRIFPI